MKLILEVATDCFRLLLWSEHSARKGYEVLSQNLKLTTQIKNSVSFKGKAISLSSRRWIAQIDSLTGETPFVSEFDGGRNSTGFAFLPRRCQNLTVGWCWFLGWGCAAVEGPFCKTDR